MDVVKVSWSGGKDSTCAVLIHLNLGHKVKVVCYVPMFTNEIPLLLKNHYEHIQNTAELFRKMGAEVHIVSGMTYWEYVTHVSKKGKYKGMIFGFPSFKRGICGFKRDSKLKALQNVDVGHFDYEDIGIAFDEVARHSQLNDQKRSILCELRITESDALKFCNDNGVLSPIYGLLTRDGCTLCPHASEKERELWFSDYPEAVPLVIELQEIVKRKRPEQSPLRGYKWFL